MSTSRSWAPPKNSTAAASAPSTGCRRTPCPDSPDLAYKEYASTPTAYEAANLSALIDFRTGLDPRTRQILDGAVAWPLRLVTRNGTVCGFVMRLIPPELFGNQTLPSGATVRLPVKAQWLMVDPAKADAAGSAVPRADDLPERIMLCKQLSTCTGCCTALDSSTAICR